MRSSPEVQFKGVGIFFRQGRIFVWDSIWNTLDDFVKTSLSQGEFIVNVNQQRSVFSNPDLATPPEMS